MSEGSLPPFGISGAVPGTLRRVLGRLFNGRVREPGSPGLRPSGPRSVDPAVSERARSVIDRHAGEHATLFERAERLAIKARRLEESGTPSESAQNRAARAREEVEAGIAALRATFVAAEGEEGGRVFDREVGSRYPALLSHG